MKRRRSEMEEVLYWLRIAVLLLAAHVGTEGVRLVNGG